jgi:hypothetical protein
VSSKTQQTVKLAIDCETGELFSAESLLMLDEPNFTSLRRAAMAARLDRRRGGSSIRFMCSICKQPLYISRRIVGAMNRWFVHDAKSEDCPWYEGNHLSPDQTKALIYRGQQEGAQHRSYKNFLATWLAKDPLVSEIVLEQTTFSQVVKGEWRRPDVKCNYQGNPLVFEIQLSYTFLSDVIARDEFYKREGIFIIWVFARFDIDRAAVTDEAFFNRRNLFILDLDAMNETSRREALTFNGYRQAPFLTDDRICDAWTTDFVTLNDVTFPRDLFRPYFFDYDVSRRALESKQIEDWRTKEAVRWKQGIGEYIALVHQLYESDDSEAARATLLSKVDSLEESHMWHRGFESLRESGFYAGHGVLSVLLSIKLNRPISYNPTLSVFQVIEAGVRTGHRNVGKHAYAILYLWAYKTYRPPMLPKHQKWLSDYAHKILESVHREETTYRRFVGYDEAIGIIFPELEEYLCTSFGCFQQ